MTDGIHISRAALHAALTELRTLGAERENDGEAAAFIIDGLSVLAALLDPQHEIAAGGGDAGDADAPPAAEAGTPAPPAIPLTAEPGNAADPPASNPSAPADATNEPASDAPPPVQAAEEPLPLVPDAEAAHAPPGDGVAPARRGSGVARTTATPERIVAIRQMWPDPALSAKDIMRRLNDLPGNPINGTGSVYGIATTAGLPTRRAELFPPASVEAQAPAAPPPEPPPAPEPTPAEPDPPRRRANFHDGSHLPAVPDDKREVIEAFGTGMSVRDAAAEFGIPLSTLSNWHAEWKLARAKEPS